MKRGGFRKMPRRRQWGKKVWWEGTQFGSIIECERAKELRLLESAQQIRDLEFHKEFWLHAKGGGQVGSYVSDAFYYDLKNQVWVVEDTKGDWKGAQTDIFSWKWRHMKHEYPEYFYHIHKRSRAA